MSESEKVTRQSLQAAAPASRPHPLAILLCLVAAALALGWWYARADVRYQYYDLGNATAIQTWSVPLPLGYEVVRWKSTPPGPQDGLRFFRPE